MQIPSIGNVSRAQTPDPTPNQKAMVIADQMRETIDQIHTYMGQNNYDGIQTEFDTLNRQYNDIANLPLTGDTDTMREVVLPWLSTNIGVLHFGLDNLKLGNAQLLNSTLGIINNTLDELTPLLKQG